MKIETVEIKYESPIDMVTSFDETATNSRNKKDTLERSADFIIKDEIDIEKTTFQK